MGEEPGPDTEELRTAKGRRIRRVLALCFLVAVAARAAEYTAWPYAGASTGWVSDSLYDPIPGPEEHTYAKGTGDVIWAWKYYNMLNPKVDKTWDGWAKYSLAGLPSGAEVTQALAHHYIYDWAGTTGGRKVVTTLDVDPSSAEASSLWSAIESATALSSSRGGLLWECDTLSAAGRAHIESGITQGWVALGYRFNDSRSGVISRISKAYGYAAGDYRPYLKITYSLTSIEEPAGTSGIYGPRFDIVPNLLNSGAATVRYCLAGTGAARVSIYDAAGKRVAERKLAGARSGVLQLDLGSLSTGIYLARLEADGLSATGKLVVQH